MNRFSRLAALCLALAGCRSTPAPAPSPQAQLFAGLGSHHRAITTASWDAQKYFDQGLTFAFAFNHDEAIRSFSRAAELDPGSAMAWWGVSLCNGPHINNPAMDPEHSRAAWEALRKAQALMVRASPPERALINALAARYADPDKGTLPLTPDQRAPFDRAYADAMNTAHLQFAHDNDIATLYAESMMDLRPWDLWSADGQPRPETPEIVAVLENVLASDPKHPGANHLYIHAIEASPHPEKAVPAADRLRTLVPAAGHLVHMPAHIDARVGRWDQANQANRDAIAADDAYRRLSPRQGFYHIYMAHNRQFLAFGCMMQGRSAEAIRAAQETFDQIPPDFFESSAAMIDGLAPIALEVRMRFGRWEEILAQPAPAENLPISTAIWHACRAIAFANTQRPGEADAQREAFIKAAAAVPPGRTVGNSPASTVLTIAGHLVDGEIAYKRGGNDEAITHLRAAVAAEDTLRYDEPPDWMQPARHTLGAVLLAAGRPAEAEKVYREDLQRWPENGWSLYGLWQALKAQNSPESAATADRFKKAWARADIQIGSSCLCVPGAP